MKIHHFFVLVALLCLTGASLPERELPRRGKDFALFIAVNNYQNWSKLQHPISEVEKVAGELYRQYDFDTLVLRNPSQDQIITALKHYNAKTYPDDGQLLIYLSTAHCPTARHLFTVDKVVETYVETPPELAQGFQRPADYAAWQETMTLPLAITCAIRLAGRPNQSSSRALLPRSHCAARSTPTSQSLCACMTAKPTMINTISCISHLC